jgi:ABC-2 type transport system permease protein
VFYPLSALPLWLQFLARLLPPAYVFEAMRDVVVRHGTASPLAVLAGGGLSILYVLLAGWVFTRVYKRVVRTGLIARYSAESL